VRLKNSLAPFFDMDKWYAKISKEAFFVKSYYSLYGIGVFFADMPYLSFRSLQGIFQSDTRFDTKDENIVKDQIPLLPASIR
jgi:hypothetical protein